MFKDSKKNGKETFTWPSGNVNVSNYKDGKKHRKVTVQLL